MQLDWLRRGKAQLNKLKTIWATIPVLILLRSLWNAIGAISNIDFIVTWLKAISMSNFWQWMIAIWEWTASPSGNLVSVIFGFLWIGYLILRPERGKQQDTISFATQGRRGIVAKGGSVKLKDSEISNQERAIEGENSDIDLDKTRIK